MYCIYIFCVNNKCTVYIYSSQDRVLIFCVCILDMFISIITDMHVDNQIRDGYMTVFVKKSKKGEILINWRTLKKKFKNC